MHAVFFCLWLSVWPLIDVRAKRPESERKCICGLFHECFSSTKSAVSFKSVLTQGFVGPEDSGVKGN